MTQYSSLLEMLGCSSCTILTFFSPPYSKPTKDPYNPDFVRPLTYEEAYPRSTQEYIKVTHGGTGDELQVDR